jgi:hypothetical protein
MQGRCRTPQKLPLALYRLENIEVNMVVKGTLHRHHQEKEYGFGFCPSENL